MAFGALSFSSIFSGVGDFHRLGTRKVKGELDLRGPTQGKQGEKPQEDIISQLKTFNSLVFILLKIGCSCTKQSITELYHRY